MKEYIDNICNFFIKNSTRFINIFKIGYLALFILVGILISTSTHYKVSNLFGEIAVLIYILTLLPGIASRLGIIHPIITVLHLYRRHLGISMYLLAYTHMLTKRYPTLVVDLTVMPTFELMGTIALLIFMILFITSNNLSQRLLGKGWIYLQKLTYLGMFFVFLHLAIVDIGKWTILLWFLIVIQGYSFYMFSKQHRA